MKIVKFCKTIVLAIIVLNSALLIIGGINILDAIVTGVFVAIPIAINYVFVSIYKKPDSDFEFVLLISFLFSFFANLSIAIFIIIMYVPGILETNALGPEVFYWGLFTIGGAMKYSLYGFIVGALVSTIYLKTRNGS